VIRDKYRVIDLSAEYTHSDKIQFTVGHAREMRRAACALEGSSVTAAFTIRYARFTARLSGSKLRIFFPEIAHIVGLI